MYAKLARGWVWAESTAAGALAHERVRDAYAIGHVLRDSLDGRGAAPTEPRFAAMQVAMQTPGGAFFVRLGAALTPGPAGVLGIEVAVAADQSGLDAVLAGAVLIAAREAATNHACAGLLRFDRGIVHQVDSSVGRYRQAARVLTTLLAELPTIADPARLAARCEALWTQPS